MDDACRFLAAFPHPDAAVEAVDTFSDMVSHSRDQINLILDDTHNSVTGGIAIP